MSTEDVNAALFVPGRLAYRSSNGWDFTAAFPHSGTSLGLVGAIEVREEEGQTPIRAEEGSVAVEIVDWLEVEVNVRLYASLRSADDDALGVIYRNTTTGASSGRKVVLGPGTRKVGTLRSVARAVQLLFSPLDPHHPAVYFPSAIPVLSEPRTMLLHRREERVVRVAFQALRTTTEAGSHYQIGLLEDLAEPTP